MIVGDVITAARDLYNAVGDSFYSDTLMYNWVWQAAHKMAQEAWLIEQVYTTNTVAGQQTYSFPTNTIAIKRVTYAGKKVKPVTFRQDDALTLSNANSVTQGFVIYYTQYNFTIYTRPIPDAVNPLSIYSFNDQTVITSSAQSLDIPTLFHMDLVDYVVSCLLAKDKDYAGAAYYRNIFSQHILEARRWKQKKKRADALTTVENEEILPVTIMGEA